MDTFEINKGDTYAGFRWKGLKKVTGLVRHRGQEAVVHYINLRSGLQGNALLKVFAAQAMSMADTDAGAHSPPSAN